MAKPFYILGVNQFEKDSAAALLKDGHLVAAVDEERFSRVKHDGAFPAHAIRYCLASAGIALADVDIVVGPLSRKSIAMRLGETETQGPDLLLPEPLQRRKADSHGLHHLSHAAASYRHSGFDTAAVLTLDAMGNDDSVVGFHFEGRDVTRIADIPWRRLSIGRLYAAVTELLGLGEHGQGKVMGLAPYGEPLPNWSDLLEIDDFEHYCSRFLEDKQHPFWRMYRMPGGEITEEHKALAASVQKALEVSVANLVRDLLKRCGTGNLCLGGGVALNCSMNGMLWALPEVEQLYLHPNAADGGTAVGLAMETWADYSESMQGIHHAYWGPQFDDTAIGQALESLSKRFSFDVEKSDDIAAAAAELLADNAVIGWFQGRAEWGPRALGARSILASAGHADNWRRVNELKGREQWRPLAPSVLEERAGEIFENYTHSPFMLMAFTVQQEWHNKVPAIVHVDGTARPQGVTATVNPVYHAMLSQYQTLTGIPLVLNTSFNHAGEPMVGTPAQAVHTALRMGLDALCIGSYLVRFPQSMDSISRKHIHSIGTGDVSYCAAHSTDVKLVQNGESDSPVYIAANASKADVRKIAAKDARSVLWSMQHCVAEHWCRETLALLPQHWYLRHTVFSEAPFRRFKELLDRQAIGSLKKLDLNIAGHRLVPQYTPLDASEHPSIRMIYGALLPWIIAFEDLWPADADIRVAEPESASCASGHETLSLHYTAGDITVAVNLAFNDSDAYRERMVLTGEKGVFTLDVSGTGEGTLLLKRSGDTEGERLRLPAFDGLEHDLSLMARGHAPQGAVSVEVASRAMRIIDAAVARWLSFALQKETDRLGDLDNITAAVDAQDLSLALRMQEQSLNCRSEAPVRLSGLSELGNQHMPRISEDEAAAMALFEELPRILVTEDLADVAVVENVALDAVEHTSRTLADAGIVSCSGHDYGLENATMRHAGGQGFTSLFIGLHEKPVHRAAELDRQMAGTTDLGLQRRLYRELLELRGIPACCIEHNLWAAFDVQAGAWGKPLTALKSPAQGHWLLNNVLSHRYLDYAPHSYTCEHSMKRARLVYEHLHSMAKVRGLATQFDALNDMQRWPLVYFDFFRFVMLEDASISSDADIIYGKAHSPLRMHHGSTENPLWTNRAYRLFAKTIVQAFNSGNRLRREGNDIVVYRNDAEMQRLHSLGALFPLVLQWSDKN